ncbi:MAG: hypothetical protein D6717_05740 [Gammaproteobacteria bacterium]|nr:MAG: hypothetical protein D6717_05740 [Gammaproteobacteria bacterium]
MSWLEPHKDHSPAGGPELLPNSPLWQRAPARDAQGRPLSDFMMIIPGLAARPAAQVRETLARIERVLKRYGETVVFADMNLQLNVLWVTVRPVPGICLELPTVIKYYVPEALLVGERFRPRGLG